MLIRRSAARRSAAAALALAAALVAAAPASADRPLNEWMFQAEPLGTGPIPKTLGTPFGTVSASDSRDWYTFATSGIQQLSVDRSPATCVGARLRSSSGASLPETYTTPDGVNRFYVDVSYDCTSSTTQGPYDILATLPGRVDAPPLPTATPTGEPNETIASAAGPLLDGQWYSGSIETSNDQDWFAAFVGPGTHQITFQATSPPVAPNSNSGGNAEIAITQGTTRVASVSGSLNVLDSRAVTITGPTTLAIRASYGGTSSSRPWWFSVASAGTGGITPSLFVPLPPPVVVRPAPPVPPVAPAPASPVAKPSCRFITKNVRRGKRIGGRCSGIAEGTRIEARFYRYTARRKTAVRKKTVYVTFANGRFVLPTTGRSKGLYRVSIWTSSKLASRQVRIR